MNTLITDCMEKGYDTSEKIAEALRRREFRENDVVAMVLWCHLKIPPTLLDAMREKYYPAFCITPEAKELFDAVYERKKLADEADILYHQQNPTQEIRNAFASLIMKSSVLERRIANLVMTTKHVTTPIEYYEREVV